MKRLWGSLQGRLLVLLALAVGLVGAVAVTLTVVDARHELDELLDGHLAQAAALLVVQQVRVHEHDDDDDDGAKVDAPVLHRYAPQVAFQVWHEGRLSMRSANAPREPMTARAQGFATETLDGRPWRLFVTRGAEHDVRVIVGEQLRSRRAILLAVLRGTAVAALLALPLLALGTWAAVRGGLSPLRRLGQQLATREPQALQPLDLPRAPSELRPLVDALNALFTRIAALLESERRFTADAAHELRTPIAAIRAQAQAASLQSDDTSRTQALQATLQGCDRAAHLVDQLLTLSRLEAQGPIDRRPLDLAALARRVAAEVASRSPAQAGGLELQAEGECLVSANEALLAVLLRNLMDNALRYAGPGAPVRVAVARGVAGGATLVVEDGGAGMAEADRARLGERFFRVAGHEAPGSGLGWSIVRRIADAHGARIELGASRELGGLSVRVQLPPA